MSSGDIERYTGRHYEKSSKYLSDKYNLSGLHRWEHDALSRYFSRAREFLLIGAGGGRETAALRKWGREVDSFECSEQFVNYANDFLRRNNIDTTIKYLPVNTVPEIVKEYDGIIVGWGTYSHIFGSKKRIAFLSALKPFCRKDTRILISFLVREGDTRRDRLSKNIANFFRFFSGGSKIETGDRLLSYFAHFFDEPEIERELAAAGYKILEYSDIDYGSVVAEVCSGDGE